MSRMAAVAAFSLASSAHPPPPTAWHLCPSAANPPPPAHGFRSACSLFPPPDSGLQLPPSACPPPPASRQQLQSGDWEPPPASWQLYQPSTAILWVTAADCSLSSPPVTAHTHTAHMHIVIVSLHCCPPAQTNKYCMYDDPFTVGCWRDRCMCAWLWYCGVLL
jgi:hypothetical protein